MKSAKRLPSRSRMSNKSSNVVFNNALACSFKTSISGCESCATPGQRKISKAFKGSVLGAKLSNCLQASIRAFASGSLIFISETLPKAGVKRRLVSTLPRFNRV